MSCFASSLASQSTLYAKRCLSLSASLPGCHSHLRPKGCSFAYVSDVLLTSWNGMIFKRFEKRLTRKEPRDMRLGTMGFQII